MPKTKTARKTVIFTIYLYRQCHRALQEGVISLTRTSKKHHFDHLDEIPRQIRQLLKSEGLTYDVHDNCDDTVITKKQESVR